MKNYVLKISERKKALCKILEYDKITKNCIVYNYRNNTIEVLLSKEMKLLNKLICCIVDFIKGKKKIYLYDYINFKII